MIIVVDTETGGLDPETSDIVELAVVELPGFSTFSTLVKTDKPIELEARAAHHISDEMLKNAPSLEDAINGSFIKNADFIAAHNAAFDMSFLKIDKPVICTWRCARHLFPDAPRHTNQVLRYYLELDDDINKGYGRNIMMLPPHRALPDAWVTAHILMKMMARGKGRSPEDMVKLTNTPILIKTMMFGMHRGKPTTDIPRDYWKWVIRQKDMDSDVVFTAKTMLGMV